MWLNSLPVLAVFFTAQTLAGDTSKTGSILEIISPATLRSQFNVSGDGFVDNQPALFGNEVMLFSFPLTNIIRRRVFHSI